MDPLPRVLVIAGALLLGVGLLLHLAPGVPLLGKLPGDIRIDRPGLRVYLPITTCLLLSVVVSLVLGFLSRMR